MGFFSSLDVTSVWETVERWHCNLGVIGEGGSWFLPQRSHLPPIMFLNPTGLEPLTLWFEMSWGGVSLEPPLHPRSLYMTVTWSCNLHRKLAGYGVLHCISVKEYKDAYPEVIKQWPASWFRHPVYVLLDINDWFHLWSRLAEIY